MWAAGCDSELGSAWPQASGGGDPGRGLSAVGRGAGAQLRGAVPGPSGEMAARPFCAGGTMPTGLCGSLGSPEPVTGWCSHDLPPTWERHGHQHRCPMGRPIPPGATCGCCLPWQGVQVDPKGHVVVDEYQNTTRRGIYALGDVCGRALLTPGTAAMPLSLHIPSVPHGAVAQAPCPPPQWPSQLPGSWPTGSSRASRTPGWTTRTSPRWFSATRPSAPWDSLRVGTHRAWRG